MIWSIQEVVGSLVLKDVAGNTKWCVEGDGWWGVVGGGGSVVEGG